ncbi:MAG: hypothetical protein R2873_02180 [Caldilineaceae bacterium]
MIGLPGDAVKAEDVVSAMVAAPCPLHPAHDGALRWSPIRSHWTTKNSVSAPCMNCPNTGCRRWSTSKDDDRLHRILSTLRR